MAAPAPLAGAASDQQPTTLQGLFRALLDRRRFKHHAAIEHERAGRDGLLSTIGKDWILGPELFSAAHPAHPLGKDGRSTTQPPARSSLLL
jgi:hypothetical protein